MNGIAFENKELRGTDLRAFVFLNDTGEKIKLFPGSQVFYKLKEKN